MSNKLVAEAVGTFILVFPVSWAILFIGPDTGKIGIAFAFGLGVVAAACGIGAASGAHLAPAVALDRVAAGRMRFGEFIGYGPAQIVCAILAGLAMLAATATDGAGPLAGLAIGLTLILIHLAGITIFGSSKTPPRSLALPLFAGRAALAQQRLYQLARLARGLLAGLPHKSGVIGTSN